MRLLEFAIVLPPPNQMTASTRLSTGDRLSGLLPLALFAARFVELEAQAKTPNLLWVCHLSNLLIALALFLGYLEVVRVSTLWLLIGAPIWPIEIARTGIMELTSIGTHYVGLAIGLLIVWKFGMGRSSWLHGLLWFLVLQAVTRIVAPPEMNINLAHSVYPGWDRLFPIYWQYWIFTSVCAALGLWLLNRLLLAVFGGDRPDRAAAHAQASGAHG